MNIKRLQHLVALAEEKSFSKAALRVHLSQPALSRSIQTLEREMGLVLINRAARGVVLTQAGATIVKRASNILFEAKCLEQDIALVKNHKSGMVSFGVGPYGAVIFLSDAMAVIRGKYPNIKIHSDVNSRDILLEKLEAEIIDFMVIEKRGIPVRPEIKLLQLPAHRASWFGRKGHPLASMLPVHIETLRLYPLVSIPLSQAIRKAIQDILCLPSDQTFEVIVECNDLFVLKELAAQTDALIFATFSSVQKEIASGQLIEIPVSEISSVTLEFGLAFLARRTLSPEAALAIEQISAVFAEKALL